MWLDWTLILDYMTWELQDLIWSPWWWDDGYFKSLKTNVVAEMREMFICFGSWVCSHCMALYWNWNRCRSFIIPEKGIYMNVCEICHKNLSGWYWMLSKHFVFVVCKLFVLYMVFWWGHNFGTNLGLTLAVPRHSDGDCKGTVTDSYRSNFDWVWLGGTGSVRSIRAFRALVSPALMGAEHISRSFLWGGVYFLAGEVLRTAVEKLALLIYMSTTAIEVNISKGAPMLFE